MAVELGAEVSLLSEEESGSVMGDAGRSLAEVDGTLANNSGVDGVEKSSSTKSKKLALRTRIISENVH